MDFSNRNWGRKYLLERIVGGVAATCFSPLLVGISVLVKTTSKGPVFYVSKRLGEKGKEFDLFKFRSMKTGSTEKLAQDGKVITEKNDQRLTSIGKFLRLGFDELAQLLNVIKGEMCLVGPRPDVVWELERYTDRERRRLYARPGITGLAQVVGGRELNNAQNYELDVRYCEQSNWKMDFKILAATVPYSLGIEGLSKRLFVEHLIGISDLEHGGHRMKESPNE